MLIFWALCAEKSSWGLRQRGMTWSSPLECKVDHEASNVRRRSQLRCFSRLRTHNQNMTVAARAIAERKTVGDLS
jgi:hypothetical protein